MSIIYPSLPKRLKVEIWRGSGGGEVTGMMTARSPPLLSSSLLTMFELGRSRNFWKIAYCLRNLAKHTSSRKLHFQTFLGDLGSMSPVCPRYLGQLRTPYLAIPPHLKPPTYTPTPHPTFHKLLESAPIDNLTFIIFSATWIAVWVCMVRGPHLRDECPLASAMKMISWRLKRNETSVRHLHLTIKGWVCDNHPGKVWDTKKTSLSSSGPSLCHAMPVLHDRERGGPELD